MTFQARDSFLFEGEPWAIHHIRGERPRPPSDGTLEPGPFADTSLQRGRVDTWALAGRQLQFVGVSAEPGAPRRDEVTDVRATCELLIGRAPREVPWRFEDYDERAVLRFTDGRLDRVRFIDRMPRRWWWRGVVGRSGLGRDVLVEIETPVRIAGHDIYPHQIHHELQLGRVPGDAADAGDLSALAEYSGLRRLLLQGARQVSDIGALSGLTGLRELDLGHTEVSDLSALEQMVELESLGLERTRVDSIAPLTGLPRLRVLDLRGAPVGDLEPLQRMPALRRVRVDEAQLGDPEAIAAVRALTGVEIDIETEPVPDPRKELYLQPGFTDGRPVFTPFADGVRLLEDRLPAEAFAGTELCAAALTEPIAIRREGEVVLWLWPPDDPRGTMAFALDGYHAQVGAPLRARRPDQRDWREMVARMAMLGPGPLRLMRGTGELPRETHLATLASLVELHSDELRLVPPPSRCAVYRDEHGRELHVGAHGTELCVWVPGAPAWIVHWRLEAGYLDPVPRPAPWAELLAGPAAPRAPLANEPDAVAFELAPSGASAVAFLDGGRSIAVASPGGIDIVATADGARLAQLSLPGEGPVTWLRDQDGLVVAQHGRIWIRTPGAPDWTPRGSLYEDRAPVDSLALDPQLRWGAFVRNETVHIGKLWGGSPRAFDLDGQWEGFQVHRIVPGPQGAYIVASGAERGGSYGGSRFDAIGILSLSGELLDRHYEEDFKVERPVAVTPEGKHALIVIGGALEAYALPADATRATSLDHVTSGSFYYPACTAIACGPGGLVVLGSDDGSIQQAVLLGLYPPHYEIVDAWYENDLECHELPVAHQAAIVELAMCPRGTTLVSRCAAGRVVVWRAQVDE